MTAQPSGIARVIFSIPGIMAHSLAAMPATDRRKVLLEIQRMVTKRARKLAAAAPRRG